MDREFFEAVSALQKERNISSNAICTEFISIARSAVSYLCTVPSICLFLPYLLKSSATLSCGFIFASVLLNFIGFYINFIFNAFF